MQTYIRPKQAAQHLGIGLSTLWLWAKNNPAFPKPIKLSPGVTVFRIAELDAHAAKQQAGEK